MNDEIREYNGKDFEIRELGEGVYSLLAIDSVDDNEETDWPDDSTVSGWLGKDVQFIEGGDHVDYPESIYHELKPSINEAARQLGRKGGKSQSAAKQAASRENGKLGGRPKMKTELTELEKNNARYSKDEKINTTSENLALAEKANRQGNHDEAAIAFLKAVK